MSSFNVGTSVPSITAQRNLNAANAAAGAALEKLATGRRINRGSDDPSGLIASQALEARLAALDAESRAIERANSAANVADGGLAEISSLLNDANAAAVAQANTAGLSEAERDAYQLEIDSARQAAQRIAATTEFSGQRVLSGGTLSAAGASVTVASPSVPSSDSETLRAAAAQVAELRGRVGAFQANALEPAQRVLEAQRENTLAANSVIRDADFAAETARLSRAQLLADASRAALAAAGNAQAGVLRVLG